MPATFAFPCTVGLNPMAQGFASLGGGGDARSKRARRATRSPIPNLPLSSPPKEPLPT